MSSAKFVNIARLMTTYNFEIEQLPDSLKCAKCKLVLKDPCLVTCGCTFCRTCIDNIMSNGVEFCPGDSEDCGESHLLRFVSDFRANKSISRLAVKCPNYGCVYKSQLVNMEEHLRACPRMSVECPFRELGCVQDNLTAEEMNGHLMQENHRHSEILIKMVANINREIDILKRRDEDSMTEVLFLKQRDEDSKKDIQILKQREEENRREIWVLKHELVLKDGQIKTIIDKITILENKNKSIVEEKEDLANRVTILQKKIEEVHETADLGSVRVIQHIDREIAAITAVVGSNKDELVTEMRSVRNDIRSLNQGAQSIKDDVCSMKLQVESIQVLVGKVDGKCEFVVKEDVGKIRWSTLTEAKKSDFFYGAVHPYKYQLVSYNVSDNMQINLYIYPGPNDGQLTWPFTGRVVVTVADKDNPEACMSISQQCIINRPPDNGNTFSTALKFLHSELIVAKLDLSRGVRVSCVIAQGAR